VRTPGEKGVPVEHPATVEALVRPWRTATLVASAVAAVELVISVVAGVALVGKPLTEKMRDAARDRQLGTPAAAPKQRPKIGSGVARLTRIETTVMVLNGNGVTGAAHLAASRVRARGYSVGEVGNAKRTDYMRSVVMYRPGHRGEALRLARDLRIRIVGPLDGLGVRDLLGAHVVLVVA
jgi:LytR cell envelope-related transcriptional attenuator